MAYAGENRITTGIIYQSNRLVASWSGITFFEGIRGIIEVTTQNYQ